MKILSPVKRITKRSHLSKHHAIIFLLLAFSVSAHAQDRQGARFFPLTPSATHGAAQPKFLPLKQQFVQVSKAKKAALLSQHAKTAKKAKTVASKPAPLVSADSNKLLLSIYAEAQ